MLSYVNRQYGVGFSFPRQYSLKSGDDAQLSWKVRAVSNGSADPGGVTLAAVELPGNSYPGTDFKSAFVNLSVNPGMTSEACTQFSSLEKNTPVILVDTATNDREGRERKDWRNRLQHSREFCGGDHEVAADRRQVLSRLQQRSLLRIRSGHRHRRRWQRGRSHSGRSGASVWQAGKNPGYRETSTWSGS